MCLLATTFLVRPNPSECVRVYVREGVSERVCKWVYVSKNCSWQGGRMRSRVAAAVGEPLNRLCFLPLSGFPACVGHRSKSMAFLFPSDSTKNMALILDDLATMWKGFTSNLIQIEPCTRLCGGSVRGLCSPHPGLVAVRMVTRARNQYCVDDSGASGEGADWT